MTGTAPAPGSPNPREIDDPVMSIGLLARKVGLSVSAVRKYEREGLLLAHRSAAGHRLFSHEDVRRVRVIHDLIQHAGLNVRGIQRTQAVLPCWDLAGCTAERRSACPAYGDVTRPCWSIRASADPGQGNTCRGCTVYRFGTLCPEEIKHLLQDPDAAGNARPIMMERMKRKRLQMEEER